MHDNIKDHWDKIYAEKNENELSWFQSYPKTSIKFLQLFDLPLTANIIDIGGGESRFVDVLPEKDIKILGYSIFQGMLLKNQEKIGK